LLQLQRRFVLALGGSCSFCGKDTPEVSRLAGVVSHQASICEGCLGLCCDILKEDSLAVRDRSPAPPADDVVAEDDLSRLLRSLETEPEARLDWTLSELRKRMYGPPSRVPDFTCAFCDAHRRDVRKLISGPRVFICDACVGDATALASGTLHV
jgi:hypothetical protein